MMQFNLCEWVWVYVEEIIFDVGVPLNFKYDNINIGTYVSSNDTDFSNWIGSTHSRQTRIKPPVKQNF